MNDVKSFGIHDTDLIIHTPTKESFHDRPSWQQGDQETYRALFFLLKENGFVKHADGRYRDSRWSSLRATHHGGSKGDVHFHSEINLATMQFRFYEDVVRDNRNGGRYHFSKMEKAPYLWQKRVQLIHLKMAQLLMSRGFEDHTPPVFETAYEEVFERRRHTAEWHFKSVFGPEPVESYNGKDADGVMLQGGEIRCWYSRNGRLMRGRVHRDINNVWPIVVNRYEVEYGLGNHNLFTYDPAKHPRKMSLHPLVNISTALRRAVQARNYKRAARIQEALDRMATLHTFEPGDLVDVDNPRYQGPGIVDHVKPPFFVGVKVGPKGEGNLWSYEWATVRPALAT